MSTNALTKKDREIQSLRARASNALSRARQAADEVQETIVTASGAFAVPYVANKFVKDGVLLGLPAEATIGAALLGVGIMSGSDPLAHLGKGGLYAAAAKYGTEAAKK